MAIFKSDAVKSGLMFLGTAQPVASCAGRGG